jgi:L-ribulokinase
VRDKLDGPYHTSDHIAGVLCEHWAAELGLTPGIPIPVGAFDAHWDAIGAGVAEGDIVNVIGTSTCIIAIAKDAGLVPGVCGVVPGSVHPAYMGIEAGLSACGYIFESLASHRGGETGLLRLTWDNGDRTVLVNPNLGGVTLGWTLNSTAEDELFAAIEGTAFHTRVIFDRMRDHGVPLHRVIHAGGIPQHAAVLNQVYANVLDMPVMVPASSITSLGSAIFAFMACGAFTTLAEAQAALCPEYRVIEPQPAEVATYERLYTLYRDAYFALGQPDAAAAPLGHVLPTLRRIAAEVHSARVS